MKENGGIQDYSISEEGINKSIIDYFRYDLISDSSIPMVIKCNILETFTCLCKRKLTRRAINKELDGTNIFKLRERIRSNNKPFPIRLGGLKSKLQQEALTMDISMHKLCRNIIFEHFDCDKKLKESSG